MRIVLVTGTRDDEYFDKSSVQMILRDVKPDLVIHGDCSTGIDSIVKAQCEHDGTTDIPMPAMWSKYGKQAGPLRNSDMASIFKNLQYYGHELICLAFPKGTDWSGTRHCMGEAEKYGWEVINAGDQP